MAVHNDDGLIGLDRILQKIDNYAESAIVECVDDLVQSLEDNNPVDMNPKQPDWGVSRNHWQASANEYTMSSASGEAPYVGGVEAEITMRSARGRFLSAPRKGKQLTGFNINKVSNIVVSNPAPYMARLNRGHSPQAAPGWIEATIDQWMVAWRLI